MNFEASTTSKAPKLALTSMLDVIFLLLCFFVTVSVYSQWENEINIALPKAKTADEPSRMPGEIVLNLDIVGTVTVNGRILSLEELETRLRRISEHFPDQPVIIRADREAKYDSLVKLVDTCRAANIWNFSLATDADATEGDSPK